MIEEVDGMSLATVPEFSTETIEIQPESSANVYGEEIDMFDALWRTFIGNASYPHEPDIEAPLSFRPLLARRCLEIEANLSVTHQTSQKQWPSLLLGHDSFKTWYLDVRGFKVAGKCLSEIFLEYGEVYGSTDTRISANVPLASEQCINVLRSGKGLITTSKGYIGLAPSSTERGDKVCVLLGCKVPLILRPIDDYFQVIGDAYIHGIMHGEAVEGVESGVCAFRDFELC
jgi:hypothetical protein